jgi:hypothetical protein
MGCGCTVLCEEDNSNHCQGLESRYLAIPLSNITPSSCKGVLRATDMGIAMLGAISLSGPTRGVQLPPVVIFTFLLSWRSRCWR